MVKPPTDTQKPATAKRSAANLAHSTYYINRELSWLQFNERVLEEALDPGNPLLERVKFMAIFASNLDEFFMIRVSGLRRLLEQQTNCWCDDLMPRLQKAGIKLLNYDELKNKQRKLLRRHFESEIFPALTPLAFDPGHPFPHISNLSINLAVVVNDPKHGERFARLKVPHPLPRLLRIPSEERADSYHRLGLQEPKATNFVWLEEVVVANLDLLFPGLEIVAAYPFRVTRDADMEIEEDEAADLLSTMREVVESRHFGSIIRLEVDSRMPERIRSILVGNLALAPYQVYDVEGPLGVADLMQLATVDQPELQDPPMVARTPPVLATEESIFSILKRRDILLYHPYDSFKPVVDFIREAAEDPDVLAIKQTLYRVGPHSPVVKALREARQNGKQVSVLVELKARFDEANNIVWARALERAGVHVVYGLMGLKVHSKMCLVVRKEPDGLCRYVHLGTGNYNPVTARIYTDLGLFTTDPEIGSDVSDLFNALTGYSNKDTYHKLLVAPGRMREELLERIAREIRHHTEHGDGRIVFKMNALVDKACITALYQASQAGVKIDLQVRGICCLRPGVPKVSENIRVTSIVGRFLEHSRIYYFHNHGDEEILLGSADIMPRNLDGRVEVLFPVEDERLRCSIRDEILDLHLRDNVRTRLLAADGTYTRLEPVDKKHAVDSQASLLHEPAGWHLTDKA